jgi:hypothetical protein
VAEELERLGERYGHFVCCNGSVRCPDASVGRSRCLMDSHCHKTVKHGQGYRAWCVVGRQVSAAVLRELRRRRWRLAAAQGGAARARSHRRFVIPLIQLMPESLTYSVPLFLKRQCDRTLGASREVGDGDGAVVTAVGVARGESVIKCPCPLNVRLNEPIHTIIAVILARSDEYQNSKRDSPAARSAATRSPAFATSGLAWTRGSQVGAGRTVAPQRPRVIVKRLLSNISEYVSL